MSFETALIGNEQLYNVQLAIVPKKQTDLLAANAAHDVGYTAAARTHTPPRMVFTFQKI